MGVLNTILDNISAGKRMLAVLLDPEKINIYDLPELVRIINRSETDFIFVGGSGYYGHIDNFITSLKVKQPIVIFPGDINQFSPKADALLFLSLLSGRNAEMLVGQHIKVAKSVKRSGIEVIPVGYILVDGGKESNVEKYSQTKPLTELGEIVNTAIAAELLGKQLVYLEAGSGAVSPIAEEIIKTVKLNINIPLIVGGGIKSIDQMHQAFNAGADIVVIGNYFEEKAEDIITFSKNKTQ